MPPPRAARVFSCSFSALRRSSSDLRSSSDIRLIVSNARG
jgi:hypothetical protein